MTDEVPFPNYKDLRAFLRNYAQSNTTDQRAVQTFVEVESDHMHRYLRMELTWITEGKFCEETFHKIIGKKRVVRHGSYQDWAKVMLQWMSETRKRSV